MHRAPHLLFALVLACRAAPPSAPPALEGLAIADVGSALLPPVPDAPRLLVTASGLALDDRLARRGGSVRTLASWDDADRHGLPIPQAVAALEALRGSEADELVIVVEASLSYDRVFRAAASAGQARWRRLAFVARSPTGTGVLRLELPSLDSPAVGTGLVPLLAPADHEAVLSLGARGFSLGVSTRESFASGPDPDLPQALSNWRAGTCGAATVEACDTRLALTPARDVPFERVARALAAARATARNVVLGIGDPDDKAQ